MSWWQISILVVAILIVSFLVLRPRPSASLGEEVQPLPPSRPQSAPLEQQSREVVASNPYDDPNRFARQAAQRAAENARRVSKQAQEQAQRAAAQAAARGRQFAEQNRLAARNNQQARHNDIERGVGAFVDPGHLQVEKWSTIEFIAGPDTVALALETEGRKLTQASPIYVAATMRVTLLPDRNFEAEAKSPPEQETGEDRTASWQWNVKPMRSGKYTLQARVEVLKANEKGALSTVETHTRSVLVRVRVGTWKSFVNGLQSAASVGDLLATLIRSWEKTLVALAALITAAVALWAVIEKL